MTMKTVILCGGYGTRLAEETDVRPKPMVNIGPKPILVHIMELYSSFGYNDFVLALGYKGDVIKEYFASFVNIVNDYQIDFENGSINYLTKKKCDWKVTCVDTGAETLTGGRLKRLESLLKDEERFMLTYGDGVCSVNISSLVDSHLKSKSVGTVTAVRPSARFGEMSIDATGIVTDFQEKPQTMQGWINGGFFVFEREFFAYLDDDNTILERKPLESLASGRSLNAFQHHGFWQCMDTLRDKKYLNELWKSGDAPWIKNASVPNVD